MTDNTKTMPMFVRIGLWFAAAYGFFLGMQTVLAMMNDAITRNPNAWYTVPLYSGLYCLLMAHLVTKYEQVMPRVALWLIPLLAVGVFYPLIVLEGFYLDELLGDARLGFFLVGMPLAGEIVRFIRAKTSV